jgi:hypothetical protein
MPILVVKEEETDPPVQKQRILSLSLFFIHEETFRCIGICELPSLVQRRRMTLKLPVCL